MCRLTRQVVVHKLWHPPSFFPLIFLFLFGWLLLCLLYKYSTYCTKIRKKKTLTKRHIFLPHFSLLLSVFSVCSTPVSKFLQWWRLYITCICRIIHTHTTYERKTCLSPVKKKSKNRGEKKRTKLIPPQCLTDVVASRCEMIHRATTSHSYIFLFSY